jgi:hypothetical protein
MQLAPTVDPTARWHAQSDGRLPAKRRAPMSADSAIGTARMTLRLGEAGSQIGTYVSRHLLSDDRAG